MIPRLSSGTATDAEHREYLEALVDSGFEGDIRTDYATRLVTATDNSVYQIVPRAVVYPRHAEDVRRVGQLLARPGFRGVSVSPRGGGTGTNGQSLSPGVIVDVSRHMNRILETNLEQGWVRVEPGVVLDQLNAHLQPHGVFFAPNLSPSSRATLGGMINTDACGKGSRIYGKTSNHVVELEFVLPDGSSMRTSEIELSRARELAEGDGAEARIYRTLLDVLIPKRALVEQQFPKLQRFLTGYNLMHAWDPERERLNASYIVSGSEGTLGFVTEAKLRLTPIPKHKRLVVVKYAAFDDALRSAQLLVASDPGAIETVDERIIELSRQDAVWQRVGHFLESNRGPRVAAVNLVEFESDDEAVVVRKARALIDEVRTRAGQRGAPIGSYLASDAGERAALWELRKKGVGLLGNTPGDRKPIAFVEDTAVPPERLADYIRDFRAILDEHGLSYGMFGHVDVGCLHVRPALNLRDPEDEKRLRSISDRVVQLVKSYGGVMWAEHGKGFRSEYLPTFFGEELYDELRKIKAAFDPDNQLNPGKLVTPTGSAARLVSVDALKRGRFDRQIAGEALDRYRVAVDCNGNGACFNWNPDAVMCPSSKATRDRIHSPKGRAGLMREWLRQLSEAGYDAAGAVSTVRDPAPFAGERRDDEDFSHEVYDAMAGCLACKACATECPVKVDVPAFRSEFLALYHTRYRRPLRDYFVAQLEKSVDLMARAPWLFNAFFRARWFRRALERTVGIVDSPELSPTPLRALLPKDAEWYDPAKLHATTPSEATRDVILVQDAFTSFYEAPVAEAVHRLLRELGYRVFVLPFFENGKGLHVRGFLERFGKVARDNARWLREVASTGAPLVGIDPAVTLTYRDEYPHALGKAPDELGFRVLLLQEFLDERREQVRTALDKRGFQPPSTEPWTLMAHCTERTAELSSQRQWVDVFRSFGMELVPEEVGCCGMCGVFGHEAEHRTESMAIYDASWRQHLPEDRERVLATGHSCRSQAKRCDGFVPKHPATVLADALSRVRSAPVALPEAAE